MNCMKCGREIDGDQVFCPKCLESMAQHPVKPDVVIKLPQRKETPVKKSVPRKKPRTPEEQIRMLTRRNRLLTAILCFLLATSLLFLSLCIDYVRQLDVQKLLGQNYSTVETMDGCFT